MATNQPFLSQWHIIIAVLKRFYPLLMLISVTLLVWVLAKAFWLVFIPPTPPQVTPVALQPVKNQQDFTGSQLDFFVTAVSNENNNQSQPIPPPDVKVVGVTLAYPETFSYAILVVNNKARSYKINDVLDGSPYKLVQVKRDAVILADVNGKEVTIDFGQKFELDQSEAIRANSQINTSPSAVISNIPQVNGDDVLAQQQYEQPQPLAEQPSSPSNALGEAVTELQENPTDYFNRMGVMPTDNGYQVTEGASSGIKNRLGLQPGDRVISVNGQSVGKNPAQDAQLLQQVQQSGQASIQVQRGEQVITINHSF